MDAKAWAEVEEWKANYREAVEAESRALNRVREVEKERDEALMRCETLAIRNAAHASLIAAVKARKVSMDANMRQLEDLAWGAFVGGAVAAMDDGLERCEAEDEMTATLRKHFDSYWNEVVGKAYRSATDDTSGEK